MTEPIKGFDVSDHNKRIPYAALKAAGFEYAYIRVHSGFPEGHRNFEDMWREHYDGCRAAGIEVGPYWYAEEESPLGLPEQIEEFYELVEGVPWDLIPAIDVEDPDPSPEFLAKCNEAIEYLRQTWDRLVAYSYTSYRAQFLQGWERDGLLWWQADYRDTIRHDVRLAGALEETGFGRPRLAPNAHMHQHLVEPIPGVYNLKLDQNITYDLDAFRIEPRKVEPAEANPFARVELLCEVRNLANAVRDTTGQKRLDYAAELRETASRLYYVIEQDAEAARGGS